MDPFEGTLRGEIHIINEEIAPTATIINLNPIGCKTCRTENVSNPSTYSTKVLLNQSKLNY